MDDITNGEYRLTTEHGAATVYKGDERLGHYWEDSLSNGYAAFRSGNSTPIGRPKTPRGCVLKITGGKWDGKP